MVYIYIFRHISVYTSRTFITQECTEDFRDSTKKGNGCLGRQALVVAKLVNDEEKNCRFEVQMEEHWKHTLPTWSIAFRERLLEIFCD